MTNQAEVTRWRLASTIRSIATFTTPPPPKLASTSRVEQLTGLSPTRLVSLIGGFIVALLASDDEGVVLCPFRRCTDGYCPLCGATRSAGKLARGDLVGAWHRHPVLVLWTFQIAFFGALAMIARRRGRHHGLPVRNLLMANFALLVGVWLLRLGLGDIPRPTTLSFFGF